ncbi:MAG: 4-hydroxy-tetrahydrodipicolinate synthase [Solirubrobacterales bacterium]|nr:4-hydroxy-tetrahydrodipicolinate synthase [Solirubrobacterales bacterium]
MNEIRGVITAMATVFGEDGAVDLAASRNLARHLVEHGSHGLVVAGTTGESPTLDDDEKLALLGAVIEEVGDEATVILGSGSNDTRHSVELTKAAADAGADAGLVVTPYYNRPNQAGLRAHFEAVAGGSPDLPLILYNIPSRVVVNMDPGFLAELAEIPTVVGVKQANEDELEPIPGMELIAGNDTSFMDVLKLGGAAGILVASHLAGDRMREIWDLHQAGDETGAEAVDASLDPVYRAMSVTTNPIPVKAALEMAGICPARMRLPMVEATRAEKDEIRSLLSEAGIDL